MDKEGVIMQLEKMKNIGKNLAESLIAVGIKDSDDLIQVGSIEAAIRLDACANKLYALEGAILDVRWHSMDVKYRQSLYEQYLEVQKTRNINL